MPLQELGHLPKDGSGRFVTPQGLLVFHIDKEIGEPSGFSMVKEHHKKKKYK
jgi:hypothetical protein